MASSEATLYYAEQPAEEFVMEEGAVLCQRGQDFQKMMKAKKIKNNNHHHNNVNISNLYKTCFQVISKNSFITVIQLISIIDQ